MILRIALGLLSLLLVGIGGVTVLACLLFVPSFEAGNGDSYGPWAVFLTLAVLVSLASFDNGRRCLHGLRVGLVSLTAQGFVLAVMATVTVYAGFLGDPDAEWLFILTSVVATGLVLSALQRRSAAPRGDLA